MEQKPPVPSQHETQSPTKRQKAETAHTAVRNANEKRTMEGLVGLAPKYRREVVREERGQDDGTKKIVAVCKRVPLSEEERLQYPKNLLKAFDLDFPTTVADFSRGNSYYGLLDADRQEYEQVIKGVHEGLDNGDYEPFFAALGQWGPRLLLDPLVNAEVEV
jgi:hypothetical protein